MSGDCEVGKGGIIKCGGDKSKPGAGDDVDDENSKSGSLAWVGLSIGAFLLIVGAFIFRRRADLRPKRRDLR